MYLLDFILRFLATAHLFSPRQNGSKLHSARLA